MIFVIPNHKNPWGQREKPSGLLVMSPGCPGFPSFFLYSSLQSASVPSHPYVRFQRRPSIHSQAHSLLPIPELYGCHVVHFFEYAVEVFYVLVSHGFCDAFYGCIAAFQHGTCFFHSYFFQNVSKCHTGFFFNVFGEVWLGEEEFL